jgi:U3 small nucleolar RNA-associated protein 7
MLADPRSKLKQHIDPTHMEFLPYHYLLTTVGHAGYLKYHDTSTGVMLTQIPTHLGSPHSMTQNPHSAIIHLGHANGTMTLWSPSMTTPHVKLLAHRGPVTGIAVDPSEGSAGRYTATSGMDGTVKLWDARMWGKEMRSWGMRNSSSCLAYSGRGMLAVGGRSGVSVFRDVEKTTSSFPYLTLPLPGLSASSVAFCPFDDILAVGHGRGVSSLLVPGSGEPNFDSAEADVYETYSRRREREVRGVLEKIRPELITLDTDFLGKVREERPQTFEEREARSYRQLGRMERLRTNGEMEDDGKGEVDGKEEDEEEEDGDTGGRKEKEKKKMRGKGGSMKRYLKKKKKNVIDSSLVSAIVAQSVMADPRSWQCGRRFQPSGRRKTQSERSLPGRLSRLLVLWLGLDEAGRIAIRLVCTRHIVTFSSFSMHRLLASAYLYGPLNSQSSSLSGWLIPDNADRLFVICGRSYHFRSSWIVRKFYSCPVHEGRL